MSDIDELFESLASLFQSDWIKYSNCADTDLEIFENPERFDEAKKICDGCCVRVECLDDAIYFNDAFYRGGLSPSERNSVELHRKRHLAAFKFDLNIQNDES